MASIQGRKEIGSGERWRESMTGLPAGFKLRVIVNDEGFCTWSSSEVRMINWNPEHASSRRVGHGCSTWCVSIEKRVLENLPIHERDSNTTVAVVHVVHFKFDTLTLQYGNVLTPKIYIQVSVHAPLEPNFSRSFLNPTSRSILITTRLVTSHVTYGERRSPHVYLGWSFWDTYLFVHARTFHWFGVDSSHIPRAFRPWSPVLTCNSRLTQNTQT